MNGFMVVLTALDATHVSEHAVPPGLDALQKAVGGYIETVPLFETFSMHGSEPHRCVAFCNEDGKANNLLVNKAATRAWDRAMIHGGHQPLIDPKTGRCQDILVGDIVVLIGDAEFLGAI